MDKLKILFYVVLVMSFLLNAVYIWGMISYRKTKTNTKFLNKPLLSLTLVVAGIGFILAWVPIFMQVWTYDTLANYPELIAILVLELIFLLAFLILAYIFAFDFGIAFDKEQENLHFFGQTISTKKIIALEEKKYSLKVVYEQGFKNIKKKITVFTPNAKKFVREILTDIVASNQVSKQSLAEQNITEITQNIDSENNS